MTYVDKKVMLDRDLAEMYGVEPRALNQAVKRNTDRFPIDFMFQLTDEKTEIKDGHTNKHGHYACFCCCSSVTVKSLLSIRVQEVSQTTTTSMTTLVCNWN